MSLVEKLFGSFSDRELKKVNPITKQVLALEPKYQAMSDADLQAQTAVFKQQLAEGKTLDDILPEAFATVRELRLELFDLALRARAEQFRKKSHTVRASTSTRCAARSTPARTT